jgi:hypothetical protein
MVGEGPAAFFSDACLILSLDPRPAAASHIVGHLLREVESAVREVLEPQANTRQGGSGDGHQRSIRAVLDELQISPEEPAARFWLGVTGEGNPSGLAMRAHRSARGAPRPVDGEFAEFVAGMEELLDRVLTRFKARYVSIFTRLDEILSEGPSKKRAARLKKNFPQNDACLSYFFGRAPAAWLSVLAEEGYFASPPGLVLHPEDSTAEMPFWPESNFLARVAAEAPGEAVDVVLGIPATDNMRVNSDLVEVAVRVPADQSARLAPKIAEIAAAPYGVLVPTRLGDLCRQLADGGYADVAMLVADSLLTNVPSAGNSRSGDTWSYAEVLREDVPALVSAAGLRALVLLADVLDQAVTAQTPASLAAVRHDQSTSWRPGLQGQPVGADTDTDPVTALVSSVRDAAVSITARGQADAREVVTVLEAHDWPVFRRLALHLLDSVGADAKDLIEARLADKTTILDAHLNREFLLLASHHCALMSLGSQQALLALIDQGPEVDDWARRHEDYTGQPPTAAETRDRVSRWQRDRLAAAQAVLTPERQAQYRALTAEYGQAPDPAAGPLAGIRPVSFASPVPAGQLAALPAGELASFLQTWEPDGSILGPTRSSLASALGDAVRQDAARRSAEADVFIGLPAVYVSAIFGSLWHALREGTVLDWEPVLRLASWADTQATAELASAPGPGRLEWGGTRLSTLRLLQAGFQPGAAEAPVSVREPAWAIIVSASADPDPCPDDEASANGQERSPGELAINHVRPIAIDAAVAFALWVRRSAPETGLSQFHDLLNTHLDPSHDPSQAVRWTYGESVAKLAALDREWTAAHAAAVFPANPAERHLWEAAWDAYLTYVPVYPDICAMLDDQYQTAVDRLQLHETGRLPEARALGLGRHLLTRYWLGELSFTSHGRLLQRYYDHGPASVRIHLMRFLGRSLSSADTLDAPVAARLRELWEARVQAVRNGADATELTAFGEWFGAGKLGDEWELQQLITALNLAGRIESEHDALPRLAALAPAHTSTCLTALEAWVRTSPHSWTLQHQEKDILAIVEAGVASSDAANAETATTIASLCITAGIDLRKALTGDQ